MVNLNDDREKISQFIITGLRNFTGKVGTPVIMGIYCCPWAGWISLNFNITLTFNEDAYSCPDFEFVEYGIEEFNNWEEEYESGEGIWVDNDLRTYHFNFNNGDESLNEFFFPFLKNLIIDLNKHDKLPSTILQFLDSNLLKKII